MKQAQNTAYLASLIIIITLVLAYFSQKLPEETRLISFLRVVGNVPPPKSSKTEELRPVIKHKFAIAKKIKTAINTEKNTETTPETIAEQPILENEETHTEVVTPTENEFWDELASEESDIIINDDNINSADKELTEDTPEEYRLLTEMEEEEIIDSLSFSSLVKKIRDNHDDKTVNRTKQKILFAYFNKLSSLRELLRSPNKKISLAVAEISSVLNYAEAEDPLFDRISFETNPDLKKAFTAHFSLFVSENATDKLNQLFLSENNVSILNTIALALCGRADEKSLAKTAELLKNNQIDEYHRSVLQTLQASHGLEEAFSYARKSISRENEAIKTRSLDIFSYSKNSADWDFLYKFKRYFFRSITLMKYFIKAKAMLLTAHLEGEKKIEKIKEIISGNKELLAWLYLYAATNTGSEGKSWVKENFSKDQDNLIICRDYVRALALVNIYLKRDASIGIFGDFREKKISADNNDATFQGGSSLNIIPHGDIFIRNNLNNIKKIQLDEEEISEDFSKEIKISDIEAGNHLIKIFLDNGEEVRKKFHLEKNTILPIELNPQDRIQTRKAHGDILMKYIPSSEYVRGKRNLNQVPHLVKISRPYLISVNEITNKEFEMFSPSHKKFRDRRSDQDNQPAVMVTWYEAVKFCNWLSKAEGLIDCYNENYIFRPYANGYRLLTEAEWEFAAGAGLPYKYFWGDELYLADATFKANFYPKGARDKDGFSFTSPAGSFPANDFGIFDMAGNVSEWCHDWYSEAPYKNNSLENTLLDPRGPKDGSMKVCRGGSWMSRDALQTSFREFDHPGVRSNTRGFRIARTVKSFIVKVNKPINKITSVKKNESSLLEI